MSDTFLKIGHRFREFQQSQVKGARLSVLLNLALRMNEYGHAWPSIDRIAHETNYSRRSVSDALKWLKNKGFIVEQDNPVTPTRSWLVKVPHLGEHMMRGAKTAPVGVQKTTPQMEKTAYKEDTGRTYSKEDVVVDPLWMKFAKDSKAKHPASWIAAMQRKGVPLPDKYKSQDRHRYVKGEYADFWEDAP